VNRVIRAFVILGTSVLMLVGCQYDPWAHGYLTTAPSESDLVGKYTPDAASRKRRISLPMSGVVLPIDLAAAITLSENHSAQFVRVPSDYNGKQPCSITGKGTWSIGQSSSRYYAVYVQIQNEEKSSPCGGEYNWPLLLYGKEPPYKLHQIIDDPDLGEAVQFEKQR